MAWKVPNAKFLTSSALPLFLFSHPKVSMAPPTHLMLAIALAAALAVAAASASSPFSVPTFYTKPGDVGNPLSRLPGLESSHPAPETMSDFADGLIGRGFTDGMTQAQLAALHEPALEQRSHTAIHEGAGLVSLNISAGLMPHVVHLDEFVPTIFAAFSAKWSCSLSPLGESSTGAPVYASLLEVSPIGGAVAPAAAVDDTKLVIAYLLARLSAPNATIAWGQRLLDMHHGVDGSESSDDPNVDPLDSNVTAAALLWDASCEDAFANRSLAPYFAVVSADLMSVSSSEPADLATQGFALQLVLMPVPILHMFATLKKELLLDPNMTQSLAQNPNAKLVLADGTTIAPGERSKDTDAAFAEGQATNRRVRRLQQLPSSSDPTLTGTTMRLQTATSIAGYQWNYGGTTGVAAVSPKQLLASVPASQFGCTTCYAYFALTLCACMR